MSKHTRILFDWTPPPPTEDEGAAVKRVVVEIARNIPDYTPPTPISADDRKDLSASARRREREREAEHHERIEALEQHEKKLQDDHRRLAKLAAEQEAEQRQLKQNQRDQEVEQRERQRRDASERQRLAVLEREWTAFKARAAQAQRAQQREAYFQDLQQTVDGLNRMVNPPAPAERQIVYVEKEEEPGGGQLPRLPSWR
jgi:predicted RNase H-like nuclease (RuvC/YqgF family)